MLVSPYPITVRGKVQPQERPMDELAEESALLRVRLEGAEISVVAGAFGAVGAQELKPALRSTNTPVERTKVRIFFSIARKCNGERTGLFFPFSGLSIEQP